MGALRHVLLSWFVCALDVLFFGCTFSSAILENVEDLLSCGPVVAHHKLKELLSELIKSTSDRETILPTLLCNLCPEISWKTHCFVPVRPLYE